MPVTVKPSSHGASSFGVGNYRHATSPEGLLLNSVMDDMGTQHAQPKGIMKSSFAGLKAGDNVYAAKNGFVYACFEAYNEHYKLIIRPEDVWFAILTQLSNFVNAHAEELRSTFVNHGGTVNLHIEVTPPVALEQFDHGKLAYEMTKVMADAIKDPTWREWILPAFTTTDKVDQSVASVIFMGTLQKYFTYSWGTRCGLPEVTLLGEVSDWEEIRRRCESRLPTLGKECKKWLETLRPALDGFVNTFKHPDSSSTKRFWQGICNVHYPNGSGSRTYSGWITSFCFWDEKGVCLHKPSGGFFGGGVRLLRGDIPSGFTKVPVTVFNMGKSIPTEMIAGSLGMRLTRSKERTKEDDKEEEKKEQAGRRVIGLDTIRPQVGWFIYRVDRATK